MSASKSSPSVKKKKCAYFIFNFNPNHVIYSVVIELEFFKTTCFYFLFYIFDILFELIIQLIRMLQKVIIKNNSFKYIPKEQNEKRQKKNIQT